MLTPAAEKQRGPQLITTGSPGPNVSRLLFLMDRTSGLRFLVDKGVEVSIVPLSVTERKH